MYNVPTYCFLTFCSLLVMLIINIIISYNYVVYIKKFYFIVIDVDLSADFGV